MNSPTQFRYWIPRPPNTVPLLIQTAMPPPSEDGRSNT